MPRGVATGPVRRLTPADGHVSAYDVEAPVACGGRGPTLLVVARDDGEAVDGSGGALLRVRVTGEGIAPRSRSPPTGLGRGAPSFVSVAGACGRRPVPGRRRSRSRGWPAASRLGSCPSIRRAAPLAAPSAEDALDDARALLFIERSDGGAPTTSNVLVATPSDSAAQLRVFACAR